jgi:tetratricopeptide (TPR) repeat protein
LTASQITDALAGDWNTCVNSSGIEGIAGCTRAITSGKYQANNLSALYFDRGNQWSDQRDDDRATQDYDEAIRLNPNFAQAYYNRDNGYLRHGRNDRAIQDYDEAIRLNPSYAEAYYNRGTAYTRKGQDDRAKPITTTWELVLKPRLWIPAFAGTTETITPPGCMAARRSDRLPLRRRSGSLW